MRGTTARRSVSQRYSRAKTPDLAKRALQTGSRAPLLSPRMQRSCSPRRPQLRPKDPQTRAGNDFRISEVQHDALSGVAQTRGYCMTFTKLILALACLMPVRLAAQETKVTQEAKVTQLMS